MKWSAVIATVLAALFLMIGQASAVQYGFYNITNNNPGDAAIGEAQLVMDVTQQGSNVLFTFTNTGPAASSICDIYFDDNVPLLSFIDFNESLGVDFTVGASPGNLPGGQAYSFSANHSYDSDSPTQPMGVNPGEYLGILFAGDFGAVIAALDEESLRVGIHVQGFATGGSESFITGTPVPEPGTLLLLGAGLVGLGFYGRRRIRG